MFSYLTHKKALTKKSKKRTLILVLLVLLLIQGLLINTSSNILWGKNTISSPDEYRHFAKARQIAYHNIGVNQMWDDPNHVDLYPSGFHIFIASFMILTDNYDAFSISIIYRVLFITAIILMIFLIGKKMNPWVGLLSIFFYNTFFFISTFVGRIGGISYKNPYPHIVSHQSYLATYIITHLLVFMAILFYIYFIEGGEKREIKIGVLLALVLIVHGISHISTYIGFVTNFGSLFLVFIFIFFKNKLIFFKHLKLLLILIISSIASYLIYYAPLIPIIIDSDYNITKVLPPGIDESFLPLLTPTSVLVFLISFGILVILYLNKYYKNIKMLKINEKYVLFLAILYVLLYISIVFLVTKNPENYNFSRFQLLNGIFPTYIPKHWNIIEKFSIALGVGMFLISVLSIIFSLRAHTKEIVYISFIFLMFYIVWFIFAVPIHYYADRIIYFMYLLPFVYALGIFYFLKKIKVLKNKKSNRNLKLAIVSILLATVLLANIITQVSVDPAIRENMNINNPLRIGVNNPPSVTYSLVVAVNYYTNKNEYILSSMLPGEALAGTTHIRPPQLQYNNLIKNNTNWILRHKAYFGNDQARKVFFYKYKARYLIVGVMDVTIGGEVPGQLAPIKEYNKSPHLLLIYAKGDGERIYLWIK